MDQQDDRTRQAVPAGGFASWLSDMGAALRGEQAADVPCGDCTACCTSSQFIHIAPDETETLGHIPDELLFDAPGFPAGHVVLGYDENGHCPMLVDGACSIYAHRPRTCRTYDCRIFPATGIDPGGDLPEIAARARRWEFTFDDSDDEVAHVAVRAAATFLADHRGTLPDGVVSSNPTQLAVVAVEVHDLFMDLDEVTGRSATVSPPPATVAAEVMRRRRSDR